MKTPLMRALRAIGTISLVVASVFAIEAVAVAQNLHLAPPAFGPDQSYVPIDIETVEIDYVFDVEKRKAWADATVTFSQKVKGKPFFDLVPKPSFLSINGEELQPMLLKEVKTPGDVTTLRVLDKTLEPNTNQKHVLKVKYNIHRRAKFRRGTVNIGFFVSDLDDRWFFERFGPTNLQFDQIKHIFNVTVKGSTAEHRIFANGSQESTGDNQWRVEFPDYYNTSTVYFHLVPTADVKVVEGVYKGKERDIPVVVYNKSGKRLERYLNEAIAKLGSLEERFGPSIHPSYTIYVSGGGGMEYSGATITSPGALGHELTHSWYARGVFPADGSSSWVDEAVASWQDTKYERGKTGPVGAPVKLVAENSYVRDTNVKAYGEGRLLMTQLDYLFKDQGGLSPILASFYEGTKRQMLTTEMFRDHIQKESGVDMTAIFAKYVYGKALFTDSEDDEFGPDGSRYPRESAAMAKPSKAAQRSLLKAPSQHPRRFTRKELYDLQ